jgi:hypothetical protein
MKHYFEYTHLDSSIKTIDELLSASNKLPLCDMTSTELLSYRPSAPYNSNLDNIWLGYSQEDRKDPTMKTKYSAGKLTKIEVGTTLYIPSDKMNRELAAVIGQGLFKNTKGSKTFMSDEVKKLINDPQFTVKSVIKSTVSGGYNIHQLISTCEVWIYVRSVNKILNLTPFVKSLNTSVSDNGSFSIEFSPSNDIFKNLYVGNHLVNYSNFVKEGVFLESWMMRFLQKNDIVFIKFEKLNGENRLSDFEVNKSRLPNQVFDMIGMVGEINQNYIASLKELQISVSGNDLSKLLIDDSACFHPYAFIEGAEDRFFVNSDEGGKYFKRLFVDGSFKTIFTASYKSIRDSLAFIFNQLTNVGILTDNDLFSSYGSRRAKAIEIEGSTMKDIEKNGIYQIVELVVDNELDDRRLADSSMFDPDSQISEQIGKICQNDFVEFWGDTFGDKYYFTARQKPFTYKQIIDYIDNNHVIEIEADVVSMFSFSFHEEYYSSYQLKPAGQFFGKGDFVHQALFPTVIIPPYLQIFGTNRMSITSNYTTYNALRGSQEKTNTNLFREAAINDLIYLIESTIYLPFARRGSITIKGGDRRIKRGTWVYFKPTNEYFYVDAVQNSIRIGSTDIDRDTTITVSRGLKEPFIKKKSINVLQETEIGKVVKRDKNYNVPSFTSSSGNAKSQLVQLPETVYTDGNRKGIEKDYLEVSYFNLVNLDYLRERLINQSEGTASGGSLKTIINNDVMEFFLLKLQFRNNEDQI